MATRSDWILNVADVAAQLEVDLARVAAEAAKPQDSKLGNAVTNALADAQRRLLSSELRAQRINALRTSDTRLQRADPQYATRAGSNNAHFLLPRPNVELDEAHYAELVSSAGAEMNALGIYSFMHLSALQKASRLAHEQLDAARRNELTLAMLSDEGFGLHFLQDSFASGHVAGTWGDAAQRKGTHDYYNENGLEVYTWNHRTRSLVLMGDAHMRPEDEQVAADAARASLELLLSVATGRSNSVLPHASEARSAPSAFDVCKTKAFPPLPDGLRVTPEIALLISPVLSQTPVPALGTGLGAVPRFRAEFGRFFGLGGALDIRGINRGFAPGQDYGGLVPGLDLGARVGLGLNGVLGEAGDGLVSLQVGLHADFASSSDFSRELLTGSGGITAAIPARTALSTRIRMPFYVIPGDLLLLAPLNWISPQTYTNMAVTAANGGLIPWQLGHATRFGRFQFVLGRELGVAFHGRGKSRNQIFVPSTEASFPVYLVSFRSTAYDLPILDYRPFRSYGGNQSSEVSVQLFAGADVPSGAKVISPEGRSVKLETVYSLGVRLRFGWRYYPEASK